MALDIRKTNDTILFTLWQGFVQKCVHPLSFAHSHFHFRVLREGIDQGIACVLCGRRCKDLCIEPQAKKVNERDMRASERACLITAVIRWYAFCAQIA